MDLTSLVLTETALLDIDAQHIVGLHPDAVPHYTVLVPVDTEHDVIAEVIDRIGLGQLREAVEVLRNEEPAGAEARAVAERVLATSVAALRAAGGTADGRVTGDDPVPELVAAAAADDVAEVVVVTVPHLVEDTLHTDWASRARERLDKPVLHLYTGTSELG